MTKLSILFLLISICSLFADAQSRKAGKPKAPTIADPNEELKETGLKCLLDILHKIDNDKSDGNFGIEKPLKMAQKEAWLSFLRIPGSYHVNSREPEK